MKPDEKSFAVGDELWIKWWNKAAHLIRAERFADLQALLAMLDANADYYFKDWAVNVKGLAKAQRELSEALAAEAYDQVESLKRRVEMSRSARRFASEHWRYHAHTQSAAKSAFLYFAKYCSVPDYEDLEASERAELEEKTKASGQAISGRDAPAYGRVIVNVYHDWKQEEIQSFKDLYVQLNHETMVARYQAIIYPSVMPSGETMVRTVQRALNVRWKSGDVHDFVRVLTDALIDGGHSISDTFDNGSDTF